LNKLTITFDNISNSEYKTDIISIMEKFYKLTNSWNLLFNLNAGISLFFPFEVFKIYYVAILKNFQVFMMNTILKVGVYCEYF